MKTYPGGPGGNGDETTLQKGPNGGAGDKIDAINVGAGGDGRCFTLCDDVELNCMWRLAGSRCISTDPTACPHMRPTSRGELVGTVLKVMPEGKCAIDMSMRSAPIPLRQFIEDQFEGNVSAFARSVGKHRNQIDKWLAAGCWWFNDDAWSPKGLNTRGPSQE